MKDWTGNTNSVFKTLASSHHTDHERQPYDYYATEPRAAQLLLKVEQFRHDIWEPACGELHLANVFKDAGYNVRCSDIVNRVDNEVLDFLDITNTHWQGDIITNPPYKYAREFVEKALSIIPDGYKVAMFLKLQFLEGKSRKHLFATYPPQMYIRFILSPQLCTKRKFRRLAHNRRLGRSLRMVCAGERI